MAFPWYTIRATLLKRLLCLGEPMDGGCYTISVHGLLLFYPLPYLSAVLHFIAAKDMPYGTIMVPLRNKDSRP